MKHTLAMVGFGGMAGWHYDLIERIDNLTVAGQVRGETVIHQLIGHVGQRGVHRLQLHAREQEQRLVKQRRCIRTAAGTRTSSR